MLGSNTYDYCFKVARMLRGCGFNVVQDFSDSSLKAQFKKANNINAKIVVVIGENEVLSNQIVLKSMDNGTQQVVNLDDVGAIVRNLINN